MHTVPTWNATLSVDNRKIDEQHRKILENCRKVVDLCSSDSLMTAQLHVTFNDFTESLLQHFQTEEQALARNGCPRLEQHKAEHDALCEQLADLLFQATQGRLNPEAWMQVAVHWSNHHLHDVDLRDGAYLHE